MKMKNQIDDKSGYQILEPFDEFDNLACEVPGFILDIRTSSSYVDVNGKESLREPEDLAFLF